MEFMQKLKSIFCISILFLSTLKPAIEDYDVTLGSQLASQEINYIKKRDPKTLQAICKFTGLSGQEKLTLPRIAIAGSGGGYRAMICFLGFMIAATKMGLVDCSSYIAALSGSTWFLGNYLMRNLPPQDFRTVLNQRVVNTSFFNPRTLGVDAIIKKLENKLVKTGSIGTVDLWGALLADRLWGDFGGDNAQEITFKRIRDLFYYTNNYPFPLFTCVTTKTFPYRWATVTPFNFRSDDLGGYIPLNAFGSKYADGKCTTLHPENSLGYFIGTFGSPYNFSLGDILELLVSDSNNQKLKNLVEWFVKNFDLYNERFLSSPEYNYTYAIDGLPMNQYLEVNFTDAGMSMVNIPFLPLLKKERGVDIILVCDASSDANYENYPEIVNAYKFIKGRGLKFPPIDNPIVINENLIIFKDENDSTVPTVIYFTNSVKDSTIKFDYTQEEFNALCDGMCSLVWNSGTAIVDEIKDKIEKQNNVELFTVDYGQPLQAKNKCCFDSFVDDMNSALDEIIEDGCTIL